MEDAHVMSLSEEDLRSLKQTFYQEATELMEALVHEILSLEEGGKTGEKLKTIKRIFHTIKGDAASVGLKNISGFAHKAEDLLKEIEGRSVDMSAESTDLLLKISDCMRGAIEASVDDKDFPSMPFVIEGIHSFLKKFREKPVKETAGTILHLSEFDMLRLVECRSKGKCLYLIRLSFSKDCEMKGAGAALLSKHLPQIGDVITITPALDSGDIERSDTIELIMASAFDRENAKALCHVPGIVSEVFIEEFKDEGLAVAPSKSPQTQESTPKPENLYGVGTIRVESERMDQIMDLLGELVLGRSMVTQLLSELEEKFPKEDIVTKFAYANSFLERSISDLQRSVMKVRMLPIARVFKRFPRVVRDLAKASGKEIRLVLHGEDTEVDKSLVDVIGEPLIHIIRNAIDHGIETIHERELAGKERQGTIVLNAYDRGNDIIIEARDDGRGIDPDMLKRKALEKGLVAKDVLDKMDDKSALDLIFLSGFSTSTAVSEVSGRGLGMDIVKTVVEGFRGSVHVKSEIGAGTTFFLRFPLTLAIIKAILFSVGERFFAIPLSSVKEITRVFISDIQLVGGREVLKLRDKVIPLVRLDNLLSSSGSQSSEAKQSYGKMLGRKRERFFVIVVTIGEKEIGMAVNSLEGEEELVVKGINDQWVSTNVIEGASILGDGRVVLILNMAALSGTQFLKQTLKASN